MRNRDRTRHGSPRVRRLFIGALCVPVAVGAMAIGAGGVGAGGGGADRASVALVDPSGAPVGFAELVQDGAGRVHVNAHVRGLTPGLHGIHVHNIASCASGATAFSGAGSHHNPAGATHGNHAGDLPNLTVNGAGVGHLNARTDHLTLDDGPLSVFDANGSALVIHANPDDLVTDPTGNSGARIACGVIAAR